MSKNIDFIKVAELLLSIYVFEYIYMDDTAYSMHTTMAFLPLLHGIIQFLSSKNRNVIEEIIRILYFVRNVLTPYLIAKAHYNISVFSVPTDSEMLLTLCLFTLETLCVFYYLHRTRIPKYRTVSLNISHKSGYLLIFWLLFVILLVLYILLPMAKDSFSAFWDENAMIKMAIAEEDKSSGLQRILETIYGILFGLYRIILPAFFLIIIRKRIKSHTVGIFLSLIVIMTQLFVVTAQSMSTLTNLAILIMLLFALYPNKKRSISIMFGGIFVAMILFIVILKMTQANGDGEVGYNLIASIFQAYVPGVYNMQGVYKMPHNGLAVLFSDFYVNIPFRNTILPIKVVDNTVELYREVNNAGGQIIPLIGQGYYHLGFFAPIVSVLMIHISMYGYKKAHEKEGIGYLKYLFYIYLSYFAAMTPCLYFFSVFGQTFMTGMLVIYIMSIYNEKCKYAKKVIGSDGCLQRGEIH